MPRERFSVYLPNKTIELRATPWTLPELACVAEIIGGSIADDTAGKHVYAEVSDTAVTVGMIYADRALTRPALTAADPYHLTYSATSRYSDIAPACTRLV